MCIPTSSKNKYFVRIISWFTENDVTIGNKSKQDTGTSVRINYSQLLIDFGTTCDCCMYHLPLSLWDLVNGVDYTEPSEF